jgi:glucuronoarabinoxylan endo-1,4-beta-xylanase
VNLYWYDYAADEDGFRLERAPNVAGNPGAWTLIATIYATNAYYGSFTDTNVVALSTNWYRVRAFNHLGNSAYTTPLRVPVVPPPAPYYLTAQPSSDRVNLSWYVDSYSYGEIGGYKVERTTNTNGTWGQIAVITNNSTYFTDTGRAPNATYWYRVRAYNWIGDSPYSPTASATIVPPATPTSLYGSLGTTNRVELYWNHYPADADGFRIERASDSGGLPGTWSEIAFLGLTNYSYANFTDTNALPNTTNWYRVRAINVVGLSPYSTAVSIAIVPPSQPQGLLAYISSSTRVDLNWYGASGRIEGYLLERAPDTNGLPGPWAQIAKPSGNYYTDTKVQTNRAYWYRVLAHNWVGNSPYSELATVRITPPPAPTNLSAHGVRNQVNLGWASGRSGVTGFRIERALGTNGLPGTWTQIYSSAYYFTNYQDYGLTYGQTYWYRVRAFNVLGDSPYSNEASVTPNPTNELGSAVVDWNNVRQRIDGFGASSAWRSTWTAAQADMFFSTNNGIGLSLLRSRIRPDGGTDELSIMQLAQARGAKVWSTPWSPPAAFKDSGNVNGGSFKGGSATNQAYASLLARYVVNMKNQGVNIVGISIQNEPDLTTTSYESCYWSSDQFHDFVPYLYNTLAASNVASTRIILPETSYWNLYPATPTMTDPTTASMVGTLAAHGYYYSAYPLERFDKALWQTEDSTFENHDGTMGNGIYWARRIHEFLTIAEVNAWHYWWLINANQSNEGLTDRFGSPAKRMYVLGQYSRFVRPNYYRIGVGNNSTALISSYKDPASASFAVVAVNPNSDLSIEQTFTLANVPVNGTITPWMTVSNLSLAARPVVGVTNGTFTYRLPPFSVVTFVGKADSLLRPGTPGQDIDPGTLPILSATVQGDQLALQIPTFPGETYAVQVSSNMVDWATVYATNTPAAIFEWIDPEPKVWPSRFYRIQMTPAAGNPASTPPPSPSPVLVPRAPAEAVHEAQE